MHLQSREERQQSGPAPALSGAEACAVAATLIPQSSEPQRTAPNADADTDAQDSGSGPLVQGPSDTEPTDHWPLISGPLPAAGSLDLPSCIAWSLRPPFCGLRAQARIACCRDASRSRPPAQHAARHARCQTMHRQLARGQPHTARPAPPLLRRTRRTLRTRACRRPRSRGVTRQRPEGRGHEGSGAAGSGKCNKYKFGDAMWNMWPITPRAASRAAHRPSPRRAAHPTRGRGQWPLAS